MKITILYDNTAFKQELQADWGFAALVEAGGLNILFDTGADGKILLSNMDKLEVDPEEIDEVFISHEHYDHLGGLSSFLGKNDDVRIYLPTSVHGVKENTTVKINEKTKLHEGIYSTGTLEGIEQALCVETPKGIVIIVGCSHPSMDKIIKTASSFGQVYGIIGGMHDSSPKALEGLQLIVAAHCTQKKEKMQKLYPDAFVEGGAGKVIEIS